MLRGGCSIIQLLRRHRLYANLGECNFVQPELQFLGHIVGADGLRVDPKKVAIVQDWPALRDKTAPAKILGPCQLVSQVRHRLGYSSCTIAAVAQAIHCLCLD